MQLLGRARRLSVMPLTALRHRAVVLLYHRVSALPTDPFGLSVHPDRFEQQLEVLKENYRPTALVDLVDAIQRGRVPPKTVVVTFDDGYLDNLTEALPRLVAADIPATFLITTANVKTQKPFWWDALEQLFMSTDERPDLTVPIGAEKCSFSLATSDERQQRLSELQDLLRPRPAREIEAVVDALQGALSTTEALKPLHPVMDLTQLRELAGNESVELGAHTRSHPSLANQPQKDQREEIIGSKQDLADWLGKEPVSFSYPFGARSSDYDKTTKATVADAGFEVALSNRRGPVVSGSDIYELPRNIVGSLDSSTFSAWLDQRFADRSGI